MPPNRTTSYRNPQRGPRLRPWRTRVTSRSVSHTTEATGHRHHRAARFLLLGSLSAALLFGTMPLGGCHSDGKTTLPRPTGRAQPRPMPSPVKAVWVARFHYRFPDDIRTIMRNCARAGLNTVLWQVRGEGTVLYPSRIEPWSAEYAYRDPGFDPLQIAVEEAHRHGLRIEAWVNVMPGWKGSQPRLVPARRRGTAAATRQILRHPESVPARGAPPYRKRDRGDRHGL